MVITVGIATSDDVKLHILTGKGNLWIINKTLHDRNKIYNQVPLIDTVAIEMCAAMATAKLRRHLHRVNTILDP